MHTIMGSVMQIGGVSKVRVFCQEATLYLLNVTNQSVKLVNESSSDHTLCAGRFLSKDFITLSGLQKMC